MMRIQWFELAGRTGYMLAAGVLIPTYRLSDTEIVLVDSGSQREPDLVPFLREKGVRVAAVLQTHLHYDHIANNKLLEDAFGTKFYASESEIRGELSPAHRSLIGPSYYDAVSAKTAFSFDFALIPIPEGSRTIEIEGTSFVIEDLCGHSSGHIGFGTPDSVLCIGDTLLSPALVRFAKLPYFEFPELAIRSMNALLPTRYRYYALAHQEIIEARDLPGLVHRNIAVQDRLDLDILELINEPVELEELVDSVIYGMDIHVRSRQMYLALYYAVLRRAEHMIRKGMLGVKPMNGIILLSKAPAYETSSRSFSSKPFRYS